MKKFIIFSAAILALASCSKDNDVKNVEDNLTPVTLGAQTGSMTTRAVWSNPEGTPQTIGVKFIPGEQFDVFEMGMSGKQVFTDADQQAFQSANFTGSWHSTGTHWAGILPSAQSNSVSMSETQNVYTVNVPADQESFTSTYSAGLSPDADANIMIAGKSDHATHTCFMSPVCAYLYFATNTSISTVKVKTATTPIAGNLKITTGVNWDGWDNYVTDGNPQFSTSSTVHEITAKGVPMERTENGVTSTHTEYIVCVLPGTYAAGDIQITTTDGTVLKKNANAQTLSAVNLYAIGVVGE